MKKNKMVGRIEEKEETKIAVAVIARHLRCQ
jgi:hypothetical protein